MLFATRPQLNIMKIRWILLPFTLIPALFVAYQFLDARREQRLYPQLDAYAVAYGLKPLRSSSPMN